jgi:hypothetical protein
MILMPAAPTRQSSFSLDGSEYEIDLSADNARVLRTALAPTSRWPGDSAPGIPAYLREVYRRR